MFLHIRRNPTTQYNKDKTPITDGVGETSPLPPALIMLFVGRGWGAELPRGLGVGLGRSRARIHTHQSEV